MSTFGTADHEASAPRPAGPSSGHAERRERILSAAATELAASGTARVRLRDIATRCGVTTGMLQYYFPSRDELLTAAFERAAMKEVDAWRAIVDAEPESGRRFERLVDHMSEELHDPAGRAVWLELCASATRTPQLQPLVHDAYEQWHAIIATTAAAAAEAGTIRPAIPIDEAARILAAAYDGFDLGLAAGGDQTASRAAGGSLRRLADVLFAPAASTAS